MNSQLRINKTRLCKRLESLARIGVVDKKGVKRLALSPEDKRARDLVVSWMKRLDMAVQIDKIGNIIGLRRGQNEEAPVMTGSHLDTVSPGGRFDGSLGVLAGLEVIQVLKERDVITRRPVAVAVFTNEEGVRYTPDMMGSLAWSGGLEIREALSIKGVDGSVLGEELNHIGYTGELDCGELRPSAFVELHVEQGPALYSESIPIGVVQSVMGISWQEITVTGVANHAGTTPVDRRHDAGFIAAKIITFLRELASSFGDNMRATCGRISVYPNVINVIPEKVTFTVDLRNSDEVFLNAAEQRLTAYFDELSAQEEVSISRRQLVRLQPVQFNKQLVNIIEEQSKKLGYHSKRMVSGAGHDAQMMARVCPTAMIFVPSKDGISHSPAEYTNPGDLEKGANVLLQTVLQLADTLVWPTHKKVYKLW